MSYRELSVTEVLDVLRIWLLGKGYRAIAELVTADRKTVRRYVEAAQVLGVARGGGVEQLTDEVLGQVAQAVRPGRRGKPGEMRALCRSQRARIEAWLDDGVLVPKVRTLLHRFTGVLVPERTLMRFVADEIGRARKPKTTVRVADGAPGKEVQVDFCDLGWVRDADSGRRRKVQALVLTPVCSRYEFVWPCWDQSVDTVIEGMEAAWQFYGGVFAVVVPDNCKCIVVSADPLHPRFCQAFLEYAQSRGFLADPARVRRPRDKARVERSVQFVQGSLLPGETFVDMATLRETALQWCLGTAGQRDHGTTHKQPAEDFAANERPHLLAAPATPYDVPEWLSVGVRCDHTITVACALYSMPTQYIGETVRVHLTRTTVKVWLHGLLVKVHVRVGKGQAQIDAADLPPGTAELARRDGATLLKQAHAHGPAVGTYVERLQAGPAPWQLARHVYRLLGLCRTYGGKALDAACRQALDFDVVDAHRIAKMLAKGLEHRHGEPPRPRLALVTPLRFARSPDEFATLRATPASPEPGRPDAAQ
ncbi:MAG: IS21 family transposase [Myxococcales bacterium]|nr:IS21 family transposase [Myxococcales bacterium]